jgi:hypothetical protein
MDSVLASTDSRFRIAVAGHERPDIVQFNDPRAIFLPAPFAPPKKPSGTDKWLKRLVIGAWARDRVAERVRMMFLDADDLVHKQLTKIALQADKRVSILLDKGYRYDLLNDELEVINGSFDRRCGSCFLPSFHRDELPQQWDLTSIYGRFRRHGDFRVLSQELGKVVKRISLHAVVYMSNHTDSLEYQKKGMRKLIKHAIPSRQATAILRNDFAFNVARQPTGSVGGEANA